MMPACTGLPPGELISSTRAGEPPVSRALRIAATTNSALAPAPAAISPLMWTMAVCGALLLMPGTVWRSVTNAMLAISTSQGSRKKVLQRRMLRCSLRVAKASFSSVARSRPGSCDESLTKWLLKREREREGGREREREREGGGGFLKQAGGPSFF